MADLPVVLVDVLERADATLVAGWYHAVSVATERVRAGLRFRRLPFLDPALPSPPSLLEVDTTADVLIEQASGMVGAIGGIAGFGGAATVPPEWVATNVAVLRLGQRLCVVYGFDPQTDKGEMALVQALAAAYGVAMPETGPLRLRVRDLPRLFRSQGSDLRGVGARLVRAMARSTAFWVAGKITRFVPVLSASSHAWDSHKNVTETGQSMKRTLRRLAEVQPQGLVEDALEVR